MEQPEQVGAVIVFGPSFSKVQAKYILNKLSEELRNDPKNETGEGLDSINVQTFNPQYGGPVFYCP